MDIRPVESSARNLGGLDYFLLWAGVAVSLAEIWAGGFLAPLGFWPGFWAIILGHLVGNTFMALGGVIGSQHGIMSMVSVRPAFGIRGSNLAAVLNIIQLVGWASIMLIIGGKAGALLAKPAGGILADNRFWVLLIGIGTLVWALYTGKTLWRVLQTVSVVALLLVCAGASWLSVRQFGSGALAVKPAEMPFMLGLDLVIAMPISWLPLVADYSRFARSTASAFWSTWWGYFLVSSWMYLLGLVATLVTGATDPASLILETMGTAGLAAPALFLVVFSTITSDFPDVYSAACSMLNISGKITARTFMWVVGLLAIIVAMIFPMEQYENFLLFIGAMFMPLFGVVLTDYFLIRRCRLEVEEIYREGGTYWYARGFSVPAIISWAVGFAVFEISALTKWVVGGSLPSMAAAAACYCLLILVFQVGRSAVPKR